MDPAAQGRAGGLGHAYGPDFMADVAAVWEQVETGPASEHRTELRRRIPPDCQVVTFPPLSALCLWPFSGSDPRLANDPGRYPWPDAIAAVLATETLPDDALFEKYLAVTSERMPDLDRRLRLDVTRWNAADAIADVKTADWVTQNLATESAVPCVGPYYGGADPLSAAATAAADGGDRRAGCKRCDPGGRAPAAVSPGAGFRERADPPAGGGAAAPAVF